MSRVAWEKAWAALEKDHGKLAIASIEVKSNPDPLVATMLMPLGVANMESTGETLAAPVAQPKDKRVSLKYWRAQVQGATWYYIAVLFDPLAKDGENKNAPPRK